MADDGYFVETESIRNVEKKKLGSGATQCLLAIVNLTDKCLERGDNLEALAPLLQAFNNMVGSNPEREAGPDETKSRPMSTANPDSSTSAQQPQPFLRTPPTDPSSHSANGNGLKPSSKLASRRQRN